MSSPFELAKSISDTFGEVSQRRDDLDAIDEILGNANATGNPQDIDNAMAQILSQVSPERQPMALKVLMDKRNNIDKRELQRLKAKESQRELQLKQLFHKENLEQKYHSDKEKAEATQQYRKDILEAQYGHSLGLENQKAKNRSDLQKEKHDQKQSLQDRENKAKARLEELKLKQKDKHFSLTLSDKKEQAKLNRELDLIKIDQKKFEFEENSKERLNKFKADSAFREKQLESNLGDSEKDRKSREAIVEMNNDARLNLLNLQQKENRIIQDLTLKQKDKEFKEKTNLQRERHETEKEQNLLKLKNQEKQFNVNQKARESQFKEKMEFQQTLLDANMGNSEKERQNRAHIKQMSIEAEAKKREEDIKEKRILEDLRKEQQLVEFEQKKELAALEQDRKRALDKEKRDLEKAEKEQLKELNRESLESQGLPRELADFPAGVQTSEIKRIRKEESEAKATKETKEHLKNIFKDIRSLYSKVGMLNQPARLWSAETRKAFGEFKGLITGIEPILKDMIAKGRLTQAEFSWIMKNPVPQESDTIETIEGKLKGLERTLKLIEEEEEEQLDEKKESKGSQKRSLSEIYK